MTGSTKKKQQTAKGYDYVMFKCDCHRKPGRGHGSGSADFFHILAVLYIRSVMLKGSILRFQELFIFEIRPPPKNRPLISKNAV